MNDGFLAQMAHASRERVVRARALRDEDAVRAAAHRAPPAPELRLSSAGFDLIAEVKLRSPAAGVLGAGDGGSEADGIAARANDYALAGAAAISVLTEPSRFDGELAHLEAVVRGLHQPVPVMRKDFLVDPYQVFEARAAGAGGILVILRMLSVTQSASLLEAAAELRLFVLLEAFDETDLSRAAALVASHGDRVRLLVGLNCRDLVTLQVVPGRLESLAPRLPRGVPRVAESGVETAADAARLAAAGYELALVGSALMRAGDRVALARSLLAAGRQGRTCG